MQKPRENDPLHRPENQSIARVVSTPAPTHYAWGWRLVILLSSLWAGLAVALISGGH